VLQVEQDGYDGSHCCRTTRQITAHDVGIWSDEHIEPLRRVTEAIKKNGAAAGIQLAHAEEKASFAVPGREENLFCRINRRGGNASVPDRFLIMKKGPSRTNWIEMKSL
jgi:2,4-dienoyl-CoA reductase-like NADH-dependent reductase (Old Yellow Enzyme family)